MSSLIAISVCFGVPVVAILYVLASVILWWHNERKARAYVNRVMGEKKKRGG